MDTYTYKGISDGKYVEGNIDAINSDEASHKLKEQKIIITNLIRAAKGKKKEEKSPKPVAKPKKPVRKTKKGGGKQPKQKKLNRRKQLEFRFDARAILDNSSVAEEHRSNIFGQIWAKGERIGIDSAIEYVSLKQQEGILTEDISNELVVLIKNYTIKR